MIHHTIERPIGDMPARYDRTILGVQEGVANAAGGSAGAAVTVAVSFGNELPPSYVVVVNPGQDATWYVSAKTSNGFSVTLTPRLATNTLAAGTFDVLVVA